MDLISIIANVGLTILFLVSLAFIITYIGENLND